MKSLGLTAVALACSIGVAAAQVAPVGPEVLSKLAPKITRAAKANGGGALNGGGATTNGPGNVATGWNYFHATNCEWYFDGTNNYLFVFPQEGGYWYSYNNLYTSQTLLTGCVNGYFEGVNVINGSTGAYNAVVTFPFK